MSVVSPVVIYLALYNILCLFLLKGEYTQDYHDSERRPEMHGVFNGDCCTKSCLAGAPKVSRKAFTHGLVSARLALPDSL